MMSHWLRQRTAYFLTALLFVSTTGIPVHKMICLCKGEQVISWFSVAEMGCCHQAEIPARSSCCSAKNGTSQRNCQDQETTLARMEVQFLADKTIQTSESTQEYYPGIGTWHSLRLPGFQPVHVLPPSYLPLHSSGPPLFRWGCQIRC